ncbi:MAG: carboxypeptidase regulatory-like domain-containing protein [Acidobacteria bacterium]|nr:carboxypeptidase regulatory-like domain-containing protein [Acidobacteriota bacterium]
MEYLRSTGSGTLRGLPRERRLAVIGLLAALLSPSFNLAEDDGPASWKGVLRDHAALPLAGVVVELQSTSGRENLKNSTNRAGAFNFAAIPAGTYRIVVHRKGLQLPGQETIQVKQGTRLEFWLELVATNQYVVLRGPVVEEPTSRGGEHISNQKVADLPLNKRDFSKLLTLESGTSTDTNSGAANFTQQFAANGQRGTAAVFAIDGIDSTDPEQGGATFSNFNVDAIEEIRSSSGVMPAEIGHGAAVSTNVMTKSGTQQVHGSLFEFHRNAALDARNFFDRRTDSDPRRLPPFVRNEFGFTNGGPVVIPSLYNGSERTFYFGQYQGFREVLGTTQVLAVPSLEERRGINTTAFPGDTLYVPVSPSIAPVLAGYPMPNDPTGPFGPRTYAASSKVVTVTNQFSVRIDHKISTKAQLFSRFSLNNVDGPLVNPDQTAIDPSFAVRFLDRQRNFGLTYTRTFSPRLISETSLGFLRTTPLFPTVNRIQPSLFFADSLFEPFNRPGGQVMGTFGNVFQFRQSLAYVRRSHSLKFGFETRINRDSAVFAFYPNGQYIFGGGTAYSAVDIPSASGLHNLRAGDPLPDSLSGFLTATPFAFTSSAAPAIFPQGDRIGLCTIRRESYNFYLQDSWRISSSFSLSLGLRYEVNTRIREANRLTSRLRLSGTFPFELNPQPAYVKDWMGFAPRLGLQWRLASRTLLRAGGAITTQLPNLFQDNFLTGSFPFVYNPFISAKPGAPVRFQNSVIRFALPPVYTPTGHDIYASGRSTDVAPNTEIDLQRFQDDLAAATRQPVLPISPFVMSPDFRNGYMVSYIAEVEQDLGEVKFTVSYVGTAGVRLASLFYPNGYEGADPAFAPFTRFDASGRIIGGLGPFSVRASRGHSTFHSLQASVQKTSSRAGLGFRISYTFGKTLDDASSAFIPPQDPSNWRAEKGISTFDVRHSMTFSVSQSLPLGRVPAIRLLGRAWTSGWKLMNISTLTGGLPFTVFSGVQQTGWGSRRADRPDQIGRPDLSVDREIREDYFGTGAANASFFRIPIGLEDGTGPNRGRHGTLGRNTFRGPGFSNFDFSLIKDTPIGKRGGSDALTVQFRAEFFNLFNIVNFAVPEHFLRGTGFGFITHTAGTSRQLQFSLKLIF